jgi:hypothetical protein
MGKMNFSGMASAIPILRNIDNTLMLATQHLNLLSSSGAKLGQVFSPMSAGATKASAATKSVATSMTQLRAVSGQATSSTTKLTSSMTAMGAAGKASLCGHNVRWTLYGSHGSLSLNPNGRNEGS